MSKQNNQSANPQVAPKFEVIPEAQNFVRILSDIHTKSVIELDNGIYVAPGSHIHHSSVIGRATAIGAMSCIYPKTAIGQFCSIADNVKIGMPEHPQHTLMYHIIQMHCDGYNLGDGFEFKETTIGNDVWIGSGACIKQGVKIGNCAAVGAMSMVTKDIPDFAIVAGNPAKIIRYKYDNITSVKDPEKLRADILDKPWWYLPIKMIQTLKAMEPEFAVKQIKICYEVLANLQQGKVRV
jgi:acetyltransferase-like isoleucine patch superfamily enzyme